MSVLSPEHFSRLQNAVVLAVVVAGAAFAIWGIPDVANATATPMDQVAVGLLVCAGPLAGWVHALVLGELSSAWPALSIATMVCLAPVGFAIRRRSDVALCVAAMLWVGTGWYFAVGMWI